MQDSQRLVLFAQGSAGSSHVMFSSRAAGGAVVPRAHSGIAQSCILVLPCLERHMVQVLQLVAHYLMMRIACCTAVLWHPD